ncbi:MAG: hypothetical protein KDD47_28155, partial [Acidobacteria bacterium]|nr:hypothetical protein [Acidobacteriota bacterium]
MPEALAWLKSYLAGATGEEPAAIGAERSLADFGLDSMGITRLQHGLEGTFGVRIPLVGLLDGPSLGDLAERLASEAPAGFRGEAGDGPAAVPLEGPRRLSEGQEALFYLQQAAPESTAYHLASAFWVEAELEEEEVRRALEETVSRHDALSSGLLVSPSSLEPRLRRLPPAQAASLSVEDATSWTSEELLAGLEVEVRRPFDLAHGPLLRLHLWRRPGGDLLLLNLHHLAGDLWSVALVWRELSERLAPGTGDGEGEARAAPSFYAWTESRRHLLEGPRGEAALAFWRRRLDPLPPPAELPADRAEGHFSGSASGAFLERLAAGSWPSLESLARRRGTTPHAVLLAAFQACLARITGLQRFTLGTLSARREE